MQEMIKKEFDLSSNKKYWPFLMGCLLISIFLCLAQISGRRALIIFCLIMFLYEVIYSCAKDISIYLLFYFLPWSPLMKLYPGGTSFFTLALIIICIYYFLKSNYNLELYQLIIPILLMIISLIAKALQGNGFGKSYILFFSMLFLFPTVIRNKKNKIKFYDLTIFFAIGIICSAISAEFVAGYPNISQYIVVDKYLNITRLSGFYGDPNYYNAHIIVCISGLLVILLQEKNLSHRIFCAVLAFILLYCGLLSGSKSFILIGSLTFFAWLILVLKKKNVGSLKLQIFIGIILTVIAVAFSEVFQNLLKIVIERFSFASNISDVTTGRSDVWMKYLVLFSHSSKLALFGEGFTNVTLQILGYKASHNTIIQMIYQFGLIGSPLLALWQYYFIKEMTNKKNMKIPIGPALVLFISIFVPWLGLDILFFDEFFLLPVYGTIGILFCNNSTLVEERPV